MPSILALYVLRSRGISWKLTALIMRYSQKKERIYFVFYCFENLSIAITLKPLVCSEVFSKWTSPDEDFKQIENWKCHMFNFQLNLLDHITYVRRYLFSSSVRMKHINPKAIVLLTYVWYHNTKVIPVWIIHLISHKKYLQNWIIFVTYIQSMKSW